MVATLQEALDEAAKRRYYVMKLCIEPSLNALQHNCDYAWREAMRNKNLMLSEPINVMVGDCLSL